MRNEPRIRGINMVSVNVNNIASDGVPFIHLANVENIETEGLHEVKRNILVVIQLQT